MRLLRRERGNWLSKEVWFSWVDVEMVGTSIMLNKHRWGFGNLTSEKPAGCQGRLQRLLAVELRPKDDQVLQTWI